jgi:AbrB family looped-hinge helix DNA binding protein
MGVLESMPVLAVTRVGRYYRTTIPREVRKLLDINENDEIEWVFEDSKVIVRKRGGRIG